MVDTVAMKFCSSSKELSKDVEVLQDDKSERPKHRFQDQPGYFGQGISFVLFHKVLLVQNLKIMLTISLAYTA